VKRATSRLVFILIGLYLLAKLQTTWAKRLSLRGWLQSQSCDACVTLSACLRSRAKFVDRRDYEYIMMAHTPRGRDVPNVMRGNRDVDSKSRTSPIPF
jgi:hypothetical protein